MTSVVASFICKANFSDFFSCSWLPSLFHVYKDIWKLSIGDNLACEREFDNCFDKFAIKVVNNGETVGHLPRKFSKIAWYRFDFEKSLVKTIFPFAACFFFFIPTF